MAELLTSGNCGGVAEAEEGELSVWVLLGALAVNVSVVDALPTPPPEDTMPVEDSREEGPT